MKACANTLTRAASGELRSVQFSDHALERIQQWGVLRADVMHVIALPQRIVRSYGRYNVFGRVGCEELRVTLALKPRRLVVVTVVKTTGCSLGEILEFKRSQFAVSAAARGAK